MSEDIIARLLARNAQQAAITAQDSATASASAAAGSASASAGSAAAAAGSAASAAIQSGNAATSASNAATSAGTANTQAGVATTQAGIATTQANNAAISASAAQAAANATGILYSATSAGAAPPYKVSGINISAAGTATSNGRFNGGSSGLSGFTWSYLASTSGGISAPLYNNALSATNTAPTLTASNGGVASATATASMAQLQNGDTFWALSSDGKLQLLWQVSGGVVAVVNGPDGSQVQQYNKLGVDGAISGLGILKKIGSATFAAIYGDNSIWWLVTPTKFLHPVIDALGAAVSSLQSLVNGVIAPAQKLVSKPGVDGLYLVGADGQVFSSITRTAINHPDYASTKAQVSSLVTNGVNSSYMVRDSKWDSIQLIGEVAHFEGYGQSLAQGYPGGLYDTGSLASALMFSGGVRPDDLSTSVGTIYASLVPLQERYLTGGMADTSANDSGSVGETPMYGAMQMLAQLMVSDAGTDPTTNGQKCMASVSARGGASAAQLTKAANVRYPRLLANLQNGPLAAAAIGKSYASGGLFYTQGEADSSAKTDPTTWTNTVLGILASVQSDWQAAAGNARPVPMFTEQSSSVAGYYAGARPDIPIAQLQMALNNDYVCHVGPSWFMSYRNNDIHMTPAGYKWLGAYYGWCAYQWLYKGYKPVPLRPVIRAEGSRIIARYPVLPGRKLVIDTSYLELMPNFGMRAFNAAGTEKTLSNPRVVGRDCVVWDASETPADAWTFGYAWNAQTAANKTTLFGGNIRDDNPLIFDPAGLNVPMYRWAPIDKITLTA